MRITLNVFNPLEGDQDKLVTLEVFPDMTAATLREFIKTETNIEPSAQHIYHNGRLISDDPKTMEQLGIADGEMLAVHVRGAVSAATANSAPVPRQAPQQQQQQQFRQPPPGQQAPQMRDPETVRLQILGSPSMRQQLERQNPDLAAVVDNPVAFAETMRSSFDREQRERVERQREISRLNEDPFNIENQHKIEEMIRQERVMENLQNAMEHNPEVFGRVHMLYVDVEVNGHKVKALVDSGAQATIMSPSCAEACGISRLIDSRFAGVARGVGTAKIVGRVHSAQIRIGNLFLPCSFTVMEGKSVDLLLGLDMLKRFQACIDLVKGSLVIQGEDIPFLGEADIPKEEEEAILDEPTIPGPPGTQIGQRSGAVLPSAPQQPAQPVQPSQSSGSPLPQAGSEPIQGGDAQASGVSSQHIETLIAMGADRARAIQALQASNDNLDMAAGILFFG